MNKRAYFVSGPESSGNRLITRLLVAGGCHDDELITTQRGHGFYSTAGTFYKLPDLIVVRRSVPYGIEWPDIKGLIAQLKEAMYDVTVVVPVRDWNGIAHSQSKNYTRTMSEALQMIERAYQEIFAAAYEMRVSMVMCSFEALVDQPVKYRNWLLGHLGLNAPDQFEEINDANQKYYKDDAESF